MREVQAFGRCHDASWSVKSQGVVFGRLVILVSRTASTRRISVVAVGEDADDIGAAADLAG